MPLNNYPGERRAGCGGGRRRRLQLAQHYRALQLLHRLAQEGVQDEGAQDLHRLPAHAQRKLLMVKLRVVQGGFFSKLL